MSSSIQSQQPLKSTRSVKTLPLLIGSGLFLLGVVGFLLYWFLIKNKSVKPPEDPCKDKKCVNGTCVNGTCNCNTGWTGTTCESVIPPSPSVICANVRCIEGVCNDQGKCTCHPGWKGISCEEREVPTPDVDPCKNVTCVNGKCNDKGVCDCYTGWSGRTCETSATPAFVCKTNSDCSNNGTCNTDFGQCRCNEGYKGIRCETNLCTGIACGNHAVCNKGSCVCTEGWSGSDCSIGCEKAPFVTLLDDARSDPTGIFNKIDFPGNDITIINTNNKAKCMEACNAQAGCVAAILSESESKCWLKTNLGMRNSWDVGTRKLLFKVAKGTCFVSPDWKSLGYTQFLGDDISVRNGVPWDECISDCASNPACLGINHAWSGKVCVLKSSIAGIKANEQFTTAFRLAKL